MYHHTYRCDDTRGCVMQFLPPDDEKMCSKHVEAWNKTVSQSTITKPFVTLRCAPTCFGPYMAILREISKQRNTVMANTLKDTQRHAESSHGPQWNNFVHALSSNDGLAKVKIYTTYSHPGSLYRLPPPPPPPGSCRHWLCMCTSLTQSATYFERSLKMSL